MLLAHGSNAQPGQGHCRATHGTTTGRERRRWVSRETARQFLPEQQRGWLGRDDFARGLDPQAGPTCNIINGSNFEPLSGRPMCSTGLAVQEQHESSDTDSHHRQRPVASALKWRTRCLGLDENWGLETATETRRGCCQGPQRFRLSSQIKSSLDRSAAHPREYGWMPADSSRDRSR